MKVKRLTNTAKLPTRAHRTDAGFDLYADQSVIIHAGERATVKTGISMQLKPGQVGLIWPRSGLAVKNGIQVLAGVIDQSYTGEILVCLYNSSAIDTCFERDGMRWELSGERFKHKVEPGDKIAQILIQDVCLCEVEEVDELADTDRGSKGFGSTDKKEKE